MKKRKMKQILKLIAKLQSDRDLYKGNMQHETQVLHLSYKENDNLRATISQLQDQISHMNTWIDNLTIGKPKPDTKQEETVFSGYFDIEEQKKVTDLEAHRRPLPPPTNGGDQ